MQEQKTLDFLLEESGKYDVKKERKVERNKVIRSFKKDFLSIKSKGFVPSNRTHDTGIGKTFEDLIGIHENNNALADYKGVLELKSARELSDSMITLFTEAPTYPKKVNTYLRETYGQPDPEFNNTKILHTTISALDFNPYVDKYGFKLNVDEVNKKIFIIIKNIKTDQIIPHEIYYTFEALRQKVEKKCENIAYINAKTKKEGEIEYFNFTKATLLSGLTFDKFILFVKGGLLVYDIRFGIFKSGKNGGKKHDHGSGFRIKKRDLNKVFKMETI